jgi:hypothetical protein
MCVCVEPIGLSVKDLMPLINPFMSARLLRNTDVRLTYVQMSLIDHDATTPLNASRSADIVATDAAALGGEDEPDIPAGDHNANTPPNNGHIEYDEDGVRTDSASNESKTLHQYTTHSVVGK